MRSAIANKWRGCFRNWNLCYFSNAVKRGFFQCGQTLQHTAGCCSDLLEWRSLSYQYICAPELASRHEPVPDAPDECLRHDMASHGARRWGQLVPRRVSRCHWHHDYRHVLLGDRFRMMESGVSISNCPSPRNPKHIPKHQRLNQAALPVGTTARMPSWSFFFLKAAMECSTSFSIASRLGGDSLLDLKRCLDGGWKFIPMFIAISNQAHEFLSCWRLSFSSFLIWLTGVKTPCFPAMSHIGHVYHEDNRRNWTTVCSPPTPLTQISQSSHP